MAHFFVASGTLIIAIKTCFCKSGWKQGSDENMQDDSIKERKAGLESHPLETQETFQLLILMWLYIIYLSLNNF